MVGWSDSVPCPRRPELIGRTFSVLETLRPAVISWKKPAPNMRIEELTRDTVNSPLSATSASMSTRSCLPLKACYPSVSHRLVDRWSWTGCCSTPSTWCLHVLNSCQRFHHLSVHTCTRLSQQTRTDVPRGFVPNDLLAALWSSESTSVHSGWSRLDAVVTSWRRIHYSSVSAGWLIHYTLQMAMPPTTVQPFEYTPEGRPCWDQTMVPRLPTGSGLCWNPLMTLSCAAVEQLVLLHLDFDLDLPFAER